MFAGRLRRPGSESSRDIGDCRRIASTPARTSLNKHVFSQRWPAGPSSQRRDQIICYTYEADRARRALRGIYEPVAKAEKLDRT